MSGFDVDLSFVFVGRYVVFYWICNVFGWYRVIDCEGFLWGFLGCSDSDERWYGCCIGWWGRNWDMIEGDGFWNKFFKKFMYFFWL